MILQLYVGDDGPQEQRRSSRGLKERHYDQFPTAAGFAVLRFVDAEDRTFSSLVVGPRQQATSSMDIVTIRFRPYLRASESHVSHCSAEAPF